MQSGIDLSISRQGASIGIFSTIPSRLNSTCFVVAALIFFLFTKIKGYKAPTVHVIAYTSSDMG